MRTYKVAVMRVQTQVVEFTVKAASEKELKSQLDSVDFSEIDHRFDEGEVDSIEYEVSRVEKTTSGEPSFADDDLQDLLD